MINNHQVHDEIIKLIETMFDCVLNLLGKPPCDYCMVSLGSLATKMTTPYSDIEYIILVKDNDADHQTYFRNFCDLFDLFMIGLGESPLSSIAKADALVAQHKDLEVHKVLARVKLGMRMDEHKRPQDFNRLFGLINTPQGFLKKLPTHMIHRSKEAGQSGNHLTSALLTTSYLWGNRGLHDEYQRLFERYLFTVEFKGCLEALLRQDAKDCDLLQESLKNRALKSSEESFEIKPLLSMSVHLVRELAIFLRSCGEKVVIGDHPFKMLDLLKTAGYITESQHKNWVELVNNLFLLRLILQRKSKSNESKISLEKLQNTITLDKLQANFREILDLIDKHLKSKKEIQPPLLSSHFQAKLKSITWNVPPELVHFVGRDALLQELHQQLTLQRQKQGKEDRETKSTIEQERVLVVSACKGLGGIGKTQLALHYLYNTQHPYTLKAWFLAESKSALEHGYASFAKFQGLTQEKVSHEEIILSVKRWFENHPGWLIVYDNVNSLEDIKAFLPAKGGSIIITTRLQNWPSNFKSLIVSEMDKKEAIELLLSFMEKKPGSTEPEVSQNESQALETLAAALGYLPLALVQAGSYIVNNIFLSPTI